MLQSAFQKKNIGSVVLRVSAFSFHFISQPYICSFYAGFWENSLFSQKMRAFSITRAELPALFTPGPYLPWVKSPAVWKSKFLF